MGAITKGLAGESLAEIGEMVDAGRAGLQRRRQLRAHARALLRNALTYVKAFPDDVVIADHCEDASLVEGGQMHEGAHSYSLGLAGRPAEAEEIIVARDLALARLTGRPAPRLPRVVARGSVELIRRAKAEGVRVTAEVTPHHLVFTDDDLVTLRHQPAR